jgi:glutathione S-transferase
MLELWQTEWCPASRRVRERLTELGVDYVARQVPVEKSERTTLIEKAGTTAIPALVTGGNSALVGEAAIRLYLDEHFTEPSEADAHRSKAEKARRRYLEEECECPQPATA